MKVHPIANEFPLAEGEDFAQLVESIRVNGLNEEIARLPDGTILDGRNRLRACKAAGVKPRYKTLNLTPEQAEAYIWAANIDRRECTRAQWLLIAAENPSVADKILKKLVVLPRAFEQVKNAIRRNPKLRARIQSKELRDISHIVRGTAEPVKRSLPSTKPEPDLVQQAIDKEAAKEEKREQVSLVERTRKAEAALASLEELRAIPELPPLVMPKSGHKKRNMAAVVLASDWHVGELVEAGRVGGKNSYDMKEAKKRVEAFFRGVVKLLRHNNQEGEIKTLVLALMGDLLHGALHADKNEKLAATPNESLLALEGWLERGVKLLLEEGIQLKMPCVVGNHGRTVKKLSANVYTDYNLEHILYCHLAQRIPEVQWGIGQDEHQNINVLGYGLHFYHGTNVRFQGGTGGLSVPLLRNAPKWDTVQPADYHCIGHWHQQRDFGKCLVNGSLVGYDAFARSLPAEYEPPRQTFFLLDQVHGKCTVSPIWLE